jgi:hypothetical protein
MAGDWLKFEANTPEKPEVLAITIELGFDDPDLTVGKLLKVWRWFDQHTVNGNAASVTPALLDLLIGVTGITQAMANVGWLHINEGGGIDLPNFERHNGKTAKDRALTAKRVASHKASKVVNDEGNGDSVTYALPREEKRREDNKKQKKKEISLKEFLEQCKTNSEKPIRDEDPIFDWTKNAGVPIEFLHIAWLVFKEKFYDADKKQADWRATFRNYVKSDWLKVWYFKDGECLLTTVGVAKQNQLRKAA